MRVISCSVDNFASYKKLDFNLIDQGLSLVQGPTGAGKSTLCDILPWVAFGKTSKGGPVDEVRSWAPVGNTVGRVCISTDKGFLNITRIRGSTKDNDLYFYYDLGSTQRGKDLNDTQKLINNLLGVDYDLYLAGAYFHEFSQTAQFFTTTAKNRRAICEQLVDLSLATNLQLKIKDKDRHLRIAIGTIEEQIRTLDSNTQLLKRLQLTENTKAAKWDEEHVKTKDYTIKRYNDFEANRKKIVSKKCNSCGTVLEQPKEIVDESTNPHLERLALLELETNPHTGAVKDYRTNINENLSDLELLDHNKSKFITELSDIEQLADVVADYRSTSIKNTVRSLETQTNQMLTAHFDAEIRVVLDVEQADKIDITISKDGNECSYTQLSKGQRCLLKLCFGVSVMRTVANHHGIKFSQIFFDEALDGLDDTLKVKAYSLLLTLSQEYESIFVVEHSEALKTMFPSSYTVQLVNGESQIEKT